MLKPKFSKYDNFVFDLDGTVWRWINLIDNVLPVFNELENLGKNCYFITNNCLLTREGIRKKLRKFGISAKYIINPSMPASRLLKKKRVLCIGKGLAIELKKQKIKLSSKPDAVVVSESKDFTYNSLSKACIAVEEGAALYKTASGSAFFYGNRRLPGTGAIASLIEKTTGIEAENIGKPSKYMADTVKTLGLNPKKTILFGDELESDIEFGNMLGFVTVLVLTGYDTINNANNSNTKPDLVLKSIADIIKR